MKNQVISQKGPFPTFMEKKPNEWEFVGTFSFADHSTDSVIIDKHYTPCKTPRSQVTAVIWLEKS